MKPEYLKSEARIRDRWMISYLDVVTILLVFFVAAAARTPPARMKAEPPPHTIQLIDSRKPKDKIEEEIRKTGLDVERQPRGLVISLPQAVLFPPGGDRIDAGALPMIEKIAEVLRAIPNYVILNGHADSVPIHNRKFKNNWELSSARSLRLLEVLHEKFGIDETRMSVSGEGSNHPAKSNDTPDGRAKNRRVEVIILNDVP